MLELQKFIKTHENWKEKIAETPYFIKVKEDGDLVMFSYNLIKGSDFLNQMVRECRGIILEKNNWDVVCHAFDKFGNYGESYVPNINWNSAVVTEKIDGSLIKVFFYNNEWCIATNNTINAFNAPIADVRYNGSFGSLFAETARLDYSKLDKSYTYIFELVSPYTQVVIPYIETAVYYLGCRNNKTNAEIPFFKENFGFKMPKAYFLMTLENTIEAANSLPYTNEGYVVVDTYCNRCKIKSPEYVKAHYLRNNNCISQKRLIEVINSGEEAEFLIYCGEYKEQIENLKTIRDEYINFLDNVIFIIKKTIAASAKNKKEFIEAVKKYEFDEFTCSFLCYWYDNRDLTFEEHSSKWTMPKWIRFYNQ